MDHSYSTERERLQRSDHSYFTVGKKTPQMCADCGRFCSLLVDADSQNFLRTRTDSRSKVVLRKAQHLHEHSLERAKSSIGQDHSYVRADHAAQRTASDFDGLEALLKAISYRESGADILIGTQRSDEMSSPQYEFQMMSVQQQDVQTFSPISYTPADDVVSADSGQTVSVNDPVSAAVTFCHTDLDNLPCWIGCIQLDHPYDSSSGNFHTVDQHSAECQQDISEPTDASDAINVNRTADVQCLCQCVDMKNCSVGLLDHAYEPSSWDFGRTCDHRHWDHAYNIRCSDDEPSLLSMGRSVSVQHLDHSYDSKMSTELSYSETVLSSFLDHAYFASNDRMVPVASGRRYASGQRWSSSDDLRAIGRPAPDFGICLVKASNFLI